MSYYPIFLNLEGRQALVVGAGAVGTHKIEGLLQARAKVRVVAAEGGAEVERWSREGRLEWRRRAYQTSDLDETDLVFAATDDPALQRRISKEARERRLWINASDAPPLCDFIAPSLLRRGDLQIAVSTGGAAPAFSKWIRRKLEPLFGPEHGELVRLARRWRPEILKLPKEERASLWERIASDSFLEQIKRDGAGPAEARLEEWIRGKRPL